MQGVDVEPKDIDIRIKIEDIQAVQNALQQYCMKKIEYSQSNGYSSFFGQFDIDGMQLDVMAGTVEKDGVKIAVKDVKFCIVDVDGAEIPCLSLQTEYEAYSNMGRHEKAGLIKAAIDSDIKF